MLIPQCHSCSGGGGGGHRRCYFTLVLRSFSNPPVSDSLPAAPVATGVSLATSFWAAIDSQSQEVAIGLVLPSRGSRSTDSVAMFLSNY